MSNKGKGILGLCLTAVGLCIIALVILNAIKTRKPVPSASVEKELNVAGVLSPETDKAMANFTTRGNWTFIPTNYRNFSLCFDLSSIPEILDRFEKEQNLDIKDWKIVYSPYDAYPHGLLIHHAPK